MFRRFMIWICVCFVSPAVQAQSSSDIVDLIRRGRIDEARESLRIMDSENGPTESVLFLCGLLATDADSAAALYENLLSSYPDSRYGDVALFRLAQLKYARGLYRSALADFSRLLREHPRSSIHQRTHYWRGLCFQALGETDSALIEIGLTIEDYPSTALTRIASRDHERLSAKNRTEPETEEPENKLRYAVQVGAFSNQTNALLQKAYIEQQGYRVDLRNKVRDGRTLYLIWVGSFDTREEARSFGEQLKKRHGIQYTLVWE